MKQLDNKKVMDLLELHEPAAPFYINNHAYPRSDIEDRLEAVDFRNPARYIVEHSKQPDISEQYFWTAHNHIQNAQRIVQGFDSAGPTPQHANAILTAYQNEWLEDDEQLDRIVRNTRWREERDIKDAVRTRLDEAGRSIQRAVDNTYGLIGSAYGLRDSELRSNQRIENEIEKIDAGSAKSMRENLYESQNELAIRDIRNRYAHHFPDYDIHLATACHPELRLEGRPLTYVHDIYIQQDSTEPVQLKGLLAKSTVNTKRDIYQALAGVANNMREEP